MYKYELVRLIPWIRYWVFLLQKTLYTVGEKLRGIFVRGSSSYCTINNKVRYYRPRYQWWLLLEGRNIREMCYMHTFMLCTALYYICTTLLYNMIRSTQLFCRLTAIGEDWLSRERVSPEFGEKRSELFFFLPPKRYHFHWNLGMTALYKTFEY